MKKLYNKFLEKISKNKFREWKLKQPLWLQLLIEIPIYIFIFWILNLIFNPFGYKITPW
jgi:hypothetical protein